MKNDKNYKMSKEIKVMSAFIRDEEYRPIFRNLFVEAEQRFTEAKKKLATKNIPVSED